jgi:enamine deaminase RidA (YjgF/YER057c/UK114 family)
MDILLPGGWKRPKGYSNAIKTKGELIFVAGQVAWNADEEIVSDRLPEQIRQALENILAILREGNAKPEHIVRMTWYVTDVEAYKTVTTEVGQIYREIIGDHYPAMSLFEVSALYEEGAQIEIEATAVIPD